MHSAIRRAITTAIGASTLALGLGGSAQPTAATTVPAFDHIFTVMMENHAYDEIIGNSQAPYVNSLANQYGSGVNHFAVSHPSLPNYLASTGGSTFGITTDCTSCFVSAPNIAADRVEPSGRSWKAYMEGYPGNCFLGDSGEYAQKHDPFLYYNDIRLNSSECAKVVPYTNLAGDLASAATTPNYVWITPNLIDDMHDGTISQGDTWLSQNIPTILNSPAWTTQNSLLMIVWDEDDSSENNQVPMLVLQKSPTAGFRSSVSHSHYSMLSTIEQSWGLAPLTTNDSGSPSMSEYFTAPTATAPGAPTGVTAVLGHHGTATISWTAPANNGGCAIFDYTVAPSPQTGTITLTSATSVKLSGLQKGVSYTFTVSATNCAFTGPGATSNSV